MEDPHALIGQVLARHAPAGWQRAWLRAIADDNYVGKMTTDYIDAQGLEQWFTISETSDLIAMTDALLDLRERMCSAGEPGFSACTFTLESDGTFRLDVQYGDASA